jgi:serine carboxypeptidase-like clade IV
MDGSILPWPGSLDRMFYFFFEHRGGNRERPVVLWLTGGPGCSSELALFYENGPFKIADNMSLVWNDYGWDKVPVSLYCTIFFPVHLYTPAY